MLEFLQPERVRPFEPCFGRDPLSARCSAPRCVLFVPATATFVGKDTIAEIPCNHWQLFLSPSTVMDFFYSASTPGRPVAIRLKLRSGEGLGDVLLSQQRFLAIEEGPPLRGTFSRTDLPSVCMLAVHELCCLYSCHELPATSTAAFTGLSSPSPRPPPDSRSCPAQLDATLMPIPFLQLLDTARTTLPAAAPHPTTLFEIESRDEKNAALTSYLWQELRAKAGLLEPAELACAFLRAGGPSASPLCDFSPWLPDRWLWRQGSIYPEVAQTLPQLLEVSTSWLVALINSLDGVHWRAAEKMSWQGGQLHPFGRPCSHLLSQEPRCSHTHSLAGLPCPLTSFPSRPCASFPSVASALPFSFPPLAWDIHGRTGYECTAALCFWPASAAGVARTSVCRIISTGSRLSWTEDYYGSE